MKIALGGAGCVIDGGILFCRRVRASRQTSRRNPSSLPLPTQSVTDLLVPGKTRSDVYRGLSGVVMDSPAALDSLGVLFADQPVLHGGRRATFLHMSGGVAIIRYWGGSHAVAVPPETLSLRSPKLAAPSRRTAASDEPTTRESAEIG